MPTRLVITVVCLSALCGLYLISTSTSFADMASTPSQQSAAAVLEVKLDHGPSPSSCEVTVKNKDVERSITFLTWDTPLDPQAINTGILSLKDLESGSLIPSPGMMVNRIQPPPRNELVELKPGSSTTKNLPLTSPWIPTDGRKYQLRLQGDWRAVWTKPAAQVTDDELAAMTGDQASAGSFDTGILEMELRR